MTINRPHPALVFAVLIIAAAALVTYLTSCAGPTVSANDPRGGILNARAEVVTQGNAIAEQGTLLARHATTIEQATDSAAATASGIATAIRQGAEALAIVANTPAAAILKSQGVTLAAADASNTTTADRLKTAQLENAQLRTLNGKLGESNASMAGVLKAAFETAAASEKEKGELKGRAEKAEQFIDDHKDDIFGAKVHRIVRAFGIATIIIVGGIIITIGILGCMYGLPKITQPAASILGSVINGVRVVGYYVGTFVLSCLGPVGHWLDEHLFNHNKMKEQVAAILHPAPILAGTNRGPLNVTTAPAAPPAV